MRRLRSWIENNRGVASIECAVGTVLIITASLLALNLYRMADTQATVTHSVFTLADYTSRDDEVNATFIEKLAEFLHAEQFAASDVAFVVSAIRQDAEDGPTLEWTKQVLLGPNAAAELTDCSKITQDGTVTLPTGFTMIANEGVIVGEVCVELTTTTGTEVVYAHYILPSRATTKTVPSLLSPDPDPDSDSDSDSGPGLEQT